MNSDSIPKGLTLSALRSFLVVAEKGGYWPAAKGESGTAANLKNQVKRLADGLGVPLTQTEGRGIKLTASGKELERVAREVLRLLSDFRQSCADERQLVRIGGGQAMFDELILPLWSDVQKRLPDHRFQFQSLRTAETITQIGEQKIDFGLVRRTAENLDKLASRKVRSMTYVLCVPRKLLTKVKGTVQIKHIPDRLPMALVGGDGELRRHLNIFAGKHGFQIEVAVEGNSLSQMRSFLLTESVAALLPESLAVESVSIVCFRGSELAEFTREVMLVWNPERMGRMDGLDDVRRELIGLTGGSSG